MGCCGSTPSLKSAEIGMSVLNLPVAPELGDGIPVPVSVDGQLRTSVKQTTRIEVDSFQGNVFVNEYLIIKDLGRGSFGKVKLCLNVEDNCLYALKLVSKRQIRHRLLAGKRRPNPNGEDELLREILVMQSLEHPNVVRLYEVIDDAEDDKLLMVMEYVEGGEVIPEEKLLNGDIGDALSEDVARMHFRDLIKGLDYLHYQNVIHRDIKTENLLLTAEVGVKLSDFGSACRIAAGNDIMVDTCGTRPFFAPEICTGEAYGGKKADIYAAGVTLYVMVFMRLPFIADTIPDLFEKIMHDEPDFSGRSDISPTLIDLLKGMLEKNPTKRMSLEQIMVHEWFTDRSNLSVIQSSKVMSLPTIDTDASTAKAMLTPNIASIFQQIPDKEMKSFSAGSYIVRRGEQLTGVYLIRKGLCTVTRGNPGSGDIDSDVEGDEDFQEDDRFFRSPASIPPKSTEGAELLNALSQPSGELTDDALFQLSRFQSLPKSEVVKGVGRRTTYQHANLRKLVEQASRDKSLQSSPPNRASKGKSTRGPGSIIGLDLAMQDGISRETVYVDEPVEAVYAPKESLEQVFAGADQKLQLRLLVAKLRRTELLRDTVQQLANLHPDFLQLEKLRSLVRNVS